VMQISMASSRISAVISVYFTSGYLACHNHPQHICMYMM
jgi:hypothetical protein